MKAGVRRMAMGGLGGCLLAIPFCRAVPRPPAVSTIRTLPLVRPDRPRTASDTALREAQRHWMQAVRETGGQLEALAEWDPEADAGAQERQAWQALLSRSAAAGLARQAAQQAAGLARDNQEAFRAARLLALIECSSGRYLEELRQARRLAALAPRDEVALLWLRRAARCNHLPALERRANAGLAALRGQGQLR